MVGTNGGTTSLRHSTRYAAAMTVARASVGSGIHQQAAIATAMIAASARSGRRSFMWIAVARRRHDHRDRRSGRRRRPSRAALADSACPPSVAPAAARAATEARRSAIAHRGTTPLDGGAELRGRSRRAFDQCTCTRADLNAPERRVSTEVAPPAEQRRPLQLRSPVASRRRSR
jgi:hypothetical protein